MASYEALISAVAKALDGIVKGALTTARHPLRQPTEFHDDVQQVAIICNCHSHSQTCKALYYCILY